MRSLLISNRLRSPVSSSRALAAGDSFNDLGMIQASKAGFLFRSTEQIKKDYPELPACESYDELLQLIRGAL